MVYGDPFFDLTYDMLGSAHVGLRRPQYHQNQKCWHYLVGRNPRPGRLTHVPNVFQRNLLQNVMEYKGSKAPSIQRWTIKFGRRPDMAQQ
jgi:hypothetical protein